MNGGVTARPGSMTVAEFIAARVGELETDADAVHKVEHCRSVGCPDYEFTPEDCDCGVPARVLRQVTAMRAILGDWQAASGYDLPEGVEDGRDPDERIRDEQIKFALEDAVCHLAAIWAHHPDYDESWRP